MGGHALGKLADRLTVEQKNTFDSTIRSALNKFSPELVKAFRAKETFGDLDFVCIGNIDNVMREVNAHFSPKTMVKNNYYFSFDMPNDDGKLFQVDMICAKDHEAQRAYLDYMAWNDLGNLIGRVARSLGFKYGHDGLWYIFRHGEHYLREIFISNDTRKILTFLGYDSEKWVSGFDTKHDIFKFACDTPYFNSLYFDLDFQNHQDRVRNKKRVMYNDFCNFISDNGIKHKPKLDSDQRFCHLIRAQMFFGVDLLEQIETIKQEAIQTEENKKKFNGDLVKEWLNVEGKELGKILSKYKEFVGDFRMFLTNHQAEEIKGHFYEWYTNRFYPSE